MAIRLNQLLAGLFARPDEAPGSFEQGTGSSILGNSGVRSRFYMTQSRSTDSSPLRERLGFAAHSAQLGANSGDFGSNSPTALSGTGTGSTAGIDTTGLSSLLPLLDGNQQDTNNLGPLFQALLALQGRSGQGGDNSLGLFSGIQL